MTKPPERAPDEVLGELTALRESQRSVILATVDSEGYPQASYAPYVCDEWNNFYIFVSRLARHTRNLETDRKASLLFIESEDLAQQIFARRRLTYSCEVQSIARDSAEWNTQLTCMQRRFGVVMTRLSRLSDFQLLRLIPLEGRYVRDFGQAFQWQRDECDKWAHVGPGDRQ